MNHGPASNRTAIEALQLQRLQALLAVLSPANRFYAPRLQSAGLNAGVASLAEYIQRMPFTTKADLVEDQCAHPPFGTNLTFPLARYTRFSQTSATTGQPLRWLDTPESWSWMVENWVTVYRAAGVGAGDRIYFAFSFGPFLGFWLAFDAGQQLGCLCLPGGGLTSEARLRAILDNGATVLCCTPTYALRLAEVTFDRKQSHVKTIIVAGEPGGSIAAMRQKISTAWNGARVFDHHGMTEVGPVTHEYPDVPCCLAVIESSYIAEVVDEAGHAADVGELVLTNLGRVGSPLLRYRTGDLVKKTFVGEQMLLEGGILGRVDDMVIVRGVNVFPSAVEDIVRRLADVAEYRVEVRQQQATTELEMTIETVDAALAGKLEAAFKAVFNLRIPVKPAAPGTLPRFEMKAKRWVKLDETK